MKQEKVIEIIYQAIPYSEQIRNLCLEESNAVRFQWRGNVYRVDEFLHTMTVKDGFLNGNDLAILMETILLNANMENQKSEKRG